jgi:hypothetical protein
MGRHAGGEVTQARDMVPDPPGRDLMTAPERLSEAIGLLAIGFLLCRHERGRRNA